MWLEKPTQHECDENINKLHEIEPSMGKPPQIHAGSQWDQVVLSRCRIGHSRLTHAFLLKGDPPPQCIGCQLPLTLKHILLNCVVFLALHQQFYSAGNMRDRFSKVKQEEILALLRIAGHIFQIHQLITLGSI